MGKGIPGLDQAYQGLLMVILVILAVMLMLCLIRAIIGPKIADRVVAVNMMGTMTMVIIGILAVMMKEGYLADICMIYAMISFLAVSVLTKIYTGEYIENRRKQVEKSKEDSESTVEKEEVQNNGGL